MNEKDLCGSLPEDEENARYTVSDIQSPTIGKLTYKIGTRKNARDIGYKGHATYEWNFCKTCGKERWVIIRRFTVQSWYCRKCAQIKKAKIIIGKNHHAWKGGSRKNNGYVLRYLPKGHKFESMKNSTMYVLEHRLVMAKYLGRPLTSDELVHHKDGERCNNDIGNLELTIRGKHGKDHGLGYKDGFNKGYIDGLNKAKQEELWNIRTV